MGKRSYRPMPPQVREAFERGDGKALARMRAKGHETQAASRAREQAEKSALAKAEEILRHRRELQDFALRRQTNEHIVPVDADEDVEDEPVSVAETMPVSATVSASPEPDEFDRLHQMYDSVKHLARGPVLTERPKAAPRARKGILPDELHAQLSANEVYINPLDDSLQPLSPPPGVDD